MRLKNDTENFAASFNITPPYQMRVIHSSKLIYPREIYQRGVQRKRVELIAADFNEYVANEPKISFRDGHYYVMDGQNTIAARKFLNGCMAWFTNAKQANIRRETYTSQLMKGGHFTMNLPLFISSANFLLMKSLLLVLFRGLCSLLGLTAQQKIH